MSNSRFPLSALAALLVVVANCSTSGESENQPIDPRGNGEKTENTDNAQDGGVATTCEEPPADREERSDHVSLTSCQRSVPEDISPSPQCVDGDTELSNCTAHKPCGPMTGCLLERNEAIDGQVTTTYQPGRPDYVPPEPPHWEGNEPLKPMGTWMQGKSTGWFARPPIGEPQVTSGTDQPGSCDIPPVRNLMIVAIPSNQFGIGSDWSDEDRTVYNNAYWCGACAEVVGRTGRRVRVQVVTQCTMCEPYDMDLPASYADDKRQDTPFAMIDAEEYGENICKNGAQPVAWRIVPCEVCGGLVLVYIAGTGSPNAFTIRNHRIPIVDVEVKQNGTWARLRRRSVNRFFFPEGASMGPKEIRITAIDGATITGTFPTVEGKTYETTSQF